MQRPRIASDIMVTKLVTLQPDIPIFDGIARLLRFNLTGAPVIDREGRWLGLFTERCCLSVLAATGRRADEQARKSWKLPRAKDVMATSLVTLTPDMDAFDAIGLLLDRHISGAPVISEERRFLGVFSEKTSMNVLLGSAYDQLPTSRVEVFLDPDRERTITEERDLLSVTQMFLDTVYRRLPVLRGEKLVGQVSRRDVLRATYSLSAAKPSWLKAWRDWILEKTPPGAGAGEIVATYMDREARTIGEDMDLLGIAQIFNRTQARRLPVITDGKLAGQISRRDLLHAIHEMIRISPKREQSLLYLSSLEHDDPPIR
jgi:CBS domain-containing protein